MTHILAFHKSIDLTLQLSRKELDDLIRSKLSCLPSFTYVRHDIGYHADDFINNKMTLRVVVIQQNLN